MNFRSKLSALLCFLLISTSGYAQPLSTPTLFVGSGYDNSNPLLSASYDNGETWSVVENTITKNINSISSIQCSNSFCVAVGPAFQNTFMISNNKGYSWTETNRVFGLEDKATPSYLRKVLCKTQDCIAIGRHGDGPLIVEGINQGQFWLAKKISNLPPDFEKSYSYLMNVSCGGKFCITAGIYTGKKPFLIMSQNGGQTWTFVEKTDLPENAKDIRLTDTSCTGNTCIAVGEHDLNFLILSSHDKGKTWSYVKKIKNWPFTKRNQLDSVDCRGNVCVALGSFEVSIHNNHILLLRSEDKGRTWEFIDVKSGGFYNLSATKISCDGANCIASSDNYSAEKAIPYLIVSNDYGRTWTDKSSQIANLTADTKKMDISDISIKGNTALIVGSGGFLPLLLISQDSGQSWQIKTIKGFTSTKARHQTIWQG